MDSLLQLSDLPRTLDKLAFAQIVAAAPAALILVAQDGSIRLVNPQAEQMFGYTEHELQGQKVESLIPERFRARHMDMRAGFWSNFSARKMGGGRDLLGLKKDGAELPLEIGLNPINLAGEKMVLMGIIDISERRNFEQWREKQRLELQRSNADLEEFAYVVSHDLRAPLRGIAQLAEWIGEDITAIANDATLHNLKLLRERVIKLQSLMDGLLTYSRAGACTSDVEDVSLPELVAEIKMLLSPAPEFEIRFEGPDQTLRTRRAPLHIILDNLIANALKHHDRAEGHIVIGMKKTKGVAEISVSDDGPGIASKYHDKIFGIFQVAPGNSKVESNGIGLALVKKQIERHGGRIWIESAPPERGSKFTFTWTEAE